MDVCTYEVEVLVTDFLNANKRCMWMKKQNKKLYIYTCEEIIGIIRHKYFGRNNDEKIQYSMVGIMSGVFSCCV